MIVYWFPFVSMKTDWFLALFWFSLNFFESHWFPLIFVDFCWFSLFFCWFIAIVIDSHWYPLISVDFRWFSFVFCDARWFMLISCDFQIFLLMFVDFQWFILGSIDLIDFKWVQLDPRIGPNRVEFLAPIGPTLSSHWPVASVKTKEVQGGLNSQGQCPGYSLPHPRTFFYRS